MATTTTNFGWDIPQSTDLVKDGATAIAALGQDIDTAFVDFKGGTTGQVLKKTSGTDLDVEWGTASSGLTLINTTSFSAVASQAFDSVFSATYRSYIVAIRQTTSTNNNISIKYRASGATNSTSNYNYQRLNANSTSVTASRSLSNDGYGPMEFNSQVHNMDILFVDPNGSNAYKAIHTRTFTGSEMAYMSGRFNDTTSFDGFIITANTGTITGTATIWGLSA
jgi:hypothetical protein